MHNQVFQVVYEREDKEGKITDCIQYVTGPNLATVAIESERFCYQYEHELKSVKYACHIVRHYEKDLFDGDNIE